mmetsp:Transcript_23113/g.54994  ORF Transcript_23113/g.54994 Transcript_23113/m.54994 type:complete len:313 (-) Transcript_23113:202-1140(-)
MRKPITLSFASAEAITFFFSRSGTTLPSAPHMPSRTSSATASRCPLGTPVSMYISSGYFTLPSPPALAALAGAAGTSSSSSESASSSSSSASAAMRIPCSGTRATTCMYLPNATFSSSASPARSAISCKWSGPAPSRALKSSTDSTPTFFMRVTTSSFVRPTAAIAFRSAVRFATCAAFLSGVLAPPPSPPPSPSPWPDGLSPSSSSAWPCSCTSVRSSSRSHCTPEPSSAASSVRKKSTLKRVARCREVASWMDCTRANMPATLERPPLKALTRMITPLILSSSSQSTIIMFASFVVLFLSLVGRGHERLL